MHSDLIPMPSEEGEGQVGGGTYSHYGEFQALLKKWTNREVSWSVVKYINFMSSVIMTYSPQLGVRVCVSHLPLFHCEVCPGLFATPPHSALFPLLPSDVETIQARLISEVLA